MYIAKKSHPEVTVAECHQQQRLEPDSNRKSRAMILQALPRVSDCI